MIVVGYREGCNGCSEGILVDAEVHWNHLAQCFERTRKS